jgi:hypothetical protein
MSVNRDGSKGRPECAIWPDWQDSEGLKEWAGKVAAEKLCLLPPWIASGYNPSEWR